ncbi:MAG: hypothetical protein C4542_01870 [Dehalococcoidia bacterium]|nr:MAG: hypothetical protein C4542_01870 [Dehalococcoidia bacterium]
MAKIRIGEKKKGTATIGTVHYKSGKVGLRVTPTKSDAEKKAAKEEKEFQSTWVKGKKGVF